MLSDIKLLGANLLSSKRKEDLEMIKALKIKIFGLVSLFFLIFGVLPGCKEAPDNKKNIRIAVAKFSHETCTFCPKPTTIED